MTSEAFSIYGNSPLHGISKDRRQIQQYQRGRSLMAITDCQSHEENITQDSYASTVQTQHDAQERVSDVREPSKINGGVETRNLKRTVISGISKDENQSHKSGLLSPLVITMKNILGEQKINQLRGKTISMHSDVINAFVKSADTEFGQYVLAVLYGIADKNRDGKLDKDEIVVALHGLGFTWLQQKQVAGIMKRADIDGNGVIDFQEFVMEAPRTLRTNLVKLAKKNGGELGLLV